MSADASGVAAIEAAQVGKIYKSTFGKAVQALDGLSLKVMPGEIYGLLGPNGAGKTTLIKILLDIIRPTAGETFLFGRSSRHPSARRRIGYLPEDHRFPGYLTARAALDLYGALSGMSKSEREEKGGRALARVGLTEWADVKTRKYSKGMKQRLGIAQAIFHDPDLILLDEPTDGVDPVGRKAIRDLLLELHDQNKTIFINSHLLLEVEMICHEVAILHKGKVLKTGTVEELTREGNDYRVICKGEPKAALAIVQREVGKAELSPEGIRFRVQDEPQLDRVVAALGEGGSPIRELVRLKDSLEDIFIGLVEAEQAAEAAERRRA